MTSSRLITALLLVAAAATPALAAGMTGGNTGPATIDTTRAAPITLPGNATPKPTPKVDADSLSRGLFDQDPAQALAGLATVTLDAGGDVEETPASDALRAILETEMKGNAGA